MVLDPSCGSSSTRIAAGNADRASTVDMGAYELTADCNANGHPDDDDIAFGTSVDADADGVPDECQVAVSYMRSYKTHGTRGNFYIGLEMDPCNPVACEPRPGGVTWIEVGFTRPIDPASFSGAGGHGPGWLWLCNDASAELIHGQVDVTATGNAATGRMQVTTPMAEIHAAIPRRFRMIAPQGVA